MRNSDYDSMHSKGERLMVLRRRFIEIMLLCGLAGSVSLSSQTPARSVNGGVYTDQQASRGLLTYKSRCASCHADNLAGRSGPPLTGDDFAANWSSRTLLELANKIRRTMPKDDTARLTPQEAADVLAYILQAGKFPSGRAELTMDDAALLPVTFPARTLAAAKTSDVASQLPSLSASGTVAQVMRGILFPSSNIIFTTQSIDPGAPKSRQTPEASARIGSFGAATFIKDGMLSITPRSLFPSPQS
jgi:mono/diheme cytochrome c family protein